MFYGGFLDLQLQLNFNSNFKTEIESGPKTVFVVRISLQFLYFLSFFI